MLRANTSPLSRLFARSSITRRAGDWRLSLTLVIAVGVALAALVPLLQDVEWWWLSMVVATAVLGISALLRYLRLSTLVVSLGAFAALVMTVTAVFTADTAFLGLFPTEKSIGAFAALINDGGIQIAIGRAPMPPGSGTMFLVAAGAGLLALVLDLAVFPLAVPAITGPVLAAIFVTPGLVVGQDVNIVVFIALTTIWLVLLHLAGRYRRQLAAGRGATISRSRGTTGLTVGAASIVIALMVPIVAPSLVENQTNPGVGPNSVFGFNVNPILALGQNLRRDAPVTALDYQTSTPGGTYLKITDLDTFTGITWAPTPFDWQTSKLVTQMGPVPGLDSSIAVQEVTTRVAIGPMTSAGLPVPYPPTVIEGLDGSWRSSPDNLVVSSKTASTRGQDYTVTSLQVKPTAEQMRASGTVYPANVQDDLDLPEDMPAILEDTARSVTADAETPYDEALALQTYLRYTDFSYSETAPVEDSYDGNGVDVLAQFLVKKKGYCVHFSSAMAVMARTLGIPARIAVGYTEGERKGNDDLGLYNYEVTSDNLHAWPELYFDQIGWIAFEPTPGRGTPTRFVEPADPSGGLDALNRYDQSLYAGTNGPSIDESLGGSVAIATDNHVLQNTLTTLVILLGVAALLLVPAGVRWMRRRLRMRAAHGPPGSLAPLWEELIDTARDLGFRADPMETPREFAARLKRSHLLDTAALEVLVRAIERERFGPTRVGDVDPAAVAAYERLRSDLLEGADHSGRLRARFVPLSLLPFAAPVTLADR